MRTIAWLGVLALICSGTCFAADENPGKILFEVWNDIGGETAVSALTGNENYPNNPSEAQLLGAFDAPENFGDAFGGRLRGWVNAPATGNYTFWIASDDNSELWLSTNEDPKNKVKLCSVPDWCDHNNFEHSPTQKSPPIKLEAGKRYYIEALYKEGSGGDNCSVGWQLPDGKMERPIPGNRLTAPPMPKITPPPPPTVTLKSEIPQVPGHHKLMAEISKGGNVIKLPFVLYLPPAYDKNQDKYPVLLFLHGGGEGGEDLGGLYVHGPLAALRGDPNKMTEAIPFIVVGPQCSGGHRWTEPIEYKSIPVLLDLIMEKVRADRDRVTITGLSMGGRGTWRASLEAPDMWAAIVPISSDDYRKTEAPKLTARSSVFIIAGSEDGGFTEGSKAQIKSYEEAGVKINSMIYQGDGHFVWMRYYPFPDFYKWVLKQKRKDGPAIMPGSEFPSKMGTAPAAEVKSPAVVKTPDPVVKAPEIKPEVVAPPVVKAPETAKQPDAPKTEEPSALEKMIADQKLKKSDAPSKTAQNEEPKPVKPPEEVKVASLTPSAIPPVNPGTNPSVAEEKSTSVANATDVAHAATASVAVPGKGYDGPNGTAITWVLLGLGGALVVFGAVSMSGSAAISSPRGGRGSNGDANDDEDDGNDGGGGEDAPRTDRIPPPRSTTVGGRPRVKIGSRM